MVSIRRANAGVTLLELMVVMVIVGILGAIAIPAYRSYMVRANRTEAKTALLSAAGTLERCYSRDNAYNGASCAAFLALPPQLTQSGKYQVTVVANPAAFVLQAVPQGNQANDTQCGTLSLDDKNTRLATGTSGGQDCWGR
jgi:type IV pilus assembly protein PilE